MILQAKVFTVETTSIAGQTVTHAQLSTAVNEFNNSMGGCLVSCNQPHTTRIDLDRVAAEATLRMEGNSVIAKLKILETPWGKIVGSLFEAGVTMTVTPVTGVHALNDGTQLWIQRLVIPDDPASSIINSPLRQVQDWVSGENYWPMFELNDKY